MRCCVRGERFFRTRARLICGARSLYVCASNGGANASLIKRIVYWVSKECVRVGDVGSFVRMCAK